MTTPSLLLGALAAACGSDAPSSGTGGDAGQAMGGDAGQAMGGRAGSASAGRPSSGGSDAQGGDSQAGGAAQGGGAPFELHGRCRATARTGDFSAVLEPDLTTVRGQVWNVAASSVTLIEVARKGDCWLTRSEGHRCSPSCSGGEACAADGQCVPAPRSQSVGEVTISGLAEPVKMSPLMPGNNYFVGGAFPARGFEPGAHVALDAAGDDLEPFSLHGIGVDQLQLPEADWLLERGKPFRVTWNAGSVAEAVVRVSLNVDQHGTAPLNMACETKDDGELIIEVELIDALLDAGITGFPSGHVRRETVDSMTQGNACVELSVGAHVRRGLKVAGYTACVRQSDCPEGLTCNLELQRCE